MKNKGAHLIDQLIIDITENDWFCHQASGESDMEEWEKELIVAGLKSLMGTYEIVMDIDELKNLHTKLLYQDTLDLDDDGARYILRDLVEEKIGRLRNGQKPGYMVFT